MAFEFNGTNYISATSAPSGGTYPFTMAAFVKIANNTVRNIIFLGRSGASNNSALLQVYASSTNARMSLGVYGSIAAGADGTANLTFNSFQHGAGYASSATLRRIFTNGVNKTSNTVSLGTISSNLLAIWGSIALDGTGTYTAAAAGFAAEIAIWSAELTDDEITSLSKGFKSYRVRPQSLVFYSPLIRDLNDIKGGLALTNNNAATVADHPRVY